MSNPGVIILDNSKLNVLEINGPRFQIEDNIGESIHIHFGDFRLDFTIRDFLILAQGIEKALKNLLSEFNINLDHLDPRFIRKIGKHLLHLEGYQIKEFSLDELKSIEYNPGKLWRWRTYRIVDTQYFKFLGPEDSRKYRSGNGLSEYDINLLQKLRRSIEKNGYPHDNKYIVLLGNELLIRDGKRRAAILRYLYGNVRIPVIILKFKGGYSQYKFRNEINIGELAKYYLKIVVPYRILRRLRKLWRRISPDKSPLFLTRRQ